MCRTLGPDYSVKTVAPDAVEDAIDDSIAVLMITEVDYRTGRKHDMARLIAKAHAAGALVVWDLAHSAGAIPVDVAGNDTDFAVGCSYKYLNSGPGGPAFIYVAPRLADHVRPALSGWLGHEAPFAFDLDYRPGAGIERMRVGTPPVLQLAALDAALDVWDNVDMADLRARSLELQDIFIEKVEAACPALTLATPRDPAQRGSQVSFRHPQGYAIMQALIADGVIGDFRAPDILRFGFTPLYLSPEDVTRAADTLCDIMATAAGTVPNFTRAPKSPDPRHKIADFGRYAAQTRQKARQHHERRRRHTNAPRSFAQRVMRGAAFTSGGFVLSQGMRFASNLVLARLLFPEAFGLMALMSMVLTGLTMLSDTGVPQSIMQNKRGDDPDF